MSVVARPLASGYDRPVPRTHEDYFDIVVMNAILGGLFNSRINLNLREARAYTYGAFSAFDWRRAAGPFVVSTAVRTDVTVEAISEILGISVGAARLRAMRARKALQADFLPFLEPEVRSRLGREPEPPPATAV